jgi:2-oxoglutarate dehydrogenase complex dehydrogenase (E1) component-like enzyme
MSIKKYSLNLGMDDSTINLKTLNKPTDEQLRTLQEYFREMPVEEILLGLKFAKNRWSAKDAGVLKVGRKSIIQKEIHSVTSEQAQWRLKNWKMMISNYRRRGYSYPTISRLKKILIEKSKKKTK